MTKAKKVDLAMEFDVALSFAGEDRQYVEKVAHELRTLGIKVFYDKYEKVTLWGKDLYTHLDEVYSKRARYVVMFISNHYKKRLWTQHERKSAQARAFREKREYILPVRFDRTEIPGILPTTGYVEVHGTSAADLAALIRNKLGMVQRANFFPSEPDLLFQQCGARFKRAQRIVEALARQYFAMAQLMTKEERVLIAQVCLSTCPAGPPDNVHLRLDYLSRLTGIPSRQIRAMTARLDCLSIETQILRRMEEGKLAPVISIRFLPLLDDLPEEEGTRVMLAMHECIDNRLCQDCGRRAIERLDFSQLSSATCFNETQKKAEQAPATLRHEARRV